MSNDGPESDTLTEREFWELQAREMDFLSDLAEKTGNGRASLDHAFAAREIRSIIKHYNARFPNPDSATQTSVDLSAGTQQPQRAVRVGGDR